MSKYIQDIIKNRQYTDKKFNDKVENLQMIIGWISNCNMNSDNITYLEQLFKFYGLSFIFACRPFYERLDQKLIKDNTKVLNSILSSVKFMVGEELPYHIDFVAQINVFKGNSQKPANLSEGQKTFIEYWKTIRKQMRTLRTVAKQNNKKKTESQIQRFFECLDYNRKMNYFEQLLIQRYTDQALDLNYSSKQELVEQSPSKMIIEEDNKEQNPYVHVPNPKIREIPICCRTFFYQNQVIDAPQSLVLEYKNYSYPYNYDLEHILKKTMCGFLNRGGGIIFIGIKEETSTRKRLVVGDIYDENRKQDIHKFFKQIATSFYPEIIMDLRYQVKFVPLKSKKQQFVVGNYLIKVIVKYGQRDSVYSFREKEQDFFYFRTENQVLKRNARQACIELKKRVKTPLEIPKPLHKQQCPQPQFGKPLFRGEKPNPQFTNNNNKNNYSNNNNNNNNHNNNNYIKQVSERQPKGNYNEKQKYKEVNDLRNGIIIGYKLEYQKQVFGGIPTAEYKSRFVSNNEQKTICVVELSHYYMNVLKSNIDKLNSQLKRSQLRYISAQLKLDFKKLDKSLDQISIMLQDINILSKQINDHALVFETYAVAVSAFIFLYQKGIKSYFMH